MEQCRGRCKEEPQIMLNIRKKKRILKRRYNITHVAKSANPCTESTCLINGRPTDARPPRQQKNLPVSAGQGDS